MTKIETFIHHQLIKIFLLLVAVIVIGMVFYQAVEGLSTVDSFYFTTMTLTTVGFGDIVPHTTAGKIFTAAYAFVGIGIFFGFVSAVFAQSVRMQHKK